MGRRKHPEAVVLGGRVRARRQALGWSQRVLAERAELDWSYVAQVERGERNLSLLNIVRLAETLEVDPAVLVEGIRVAR